MSASIAQATLPEQEGVVPDASNVQLMWWGPRGVVTDASNVQLMWWKSAGVDREPVDVPSLARV
ncbi:hypothetical protein AB0I22_08410 [Streptomyces sp. NPDC050610]|uniref:hypothetical protein n=1 Tax=Streptomyces sp. NPDC050610 TaxID=3157097 RepID=UPI003437AC32